MPTLSQHLADLAQEAPTAHPDPGLTARARRFHRRRRRGSTAVVAVVALALGTLLGVARVQSQTEIPPAATRGAPALPDRIEQPSPWLSGTDGAGPLGRLAAVVPAERGGWWGGSKGLVGVSATTGEYRFLDLPDAAWLGDAVLSPDGRRVAYWARGTPTGSPDLTEDGELPVAALAVYDTETGDVRRHEVETAHGVMPGELAWVDADMLIVSWGDIRGGLGDPLMKRSSSTAAKLRLWALSEQGPRAPKEDARRFGEVAFTGGGVVVEPGRGEGAFRVYRAERPDEVLRLRVGRAPAGGATESTYAYAVDPTVTSIVGVSGRRSRSPNEFWAGDVPARPQAPSGRGLQVETGIVPDSRGTFGFLGWVDPEHVAVLRGAFARIVELVDTTTGESRQIVVVEGQASIAADLLGTDTVTRPPPPDPIPPRAIAWSGGLLVLLAGLALVLWRRRVQP